ncbi:major outer membrane protein [Campylobacter mucosalis]|uniref:major outer membrane protein n=1 Tax=Campylobacter mucosalis TaxID=202 RepID=UPI0014701129|nr:major outer membrane protein [Campylobacter mucosalis]
MKLTKVSLAALVALGAFSSVASATPLEEAIKNVDISGFARYRYTNNDIHFKGKTKGNEKTDIGNHRAGHQFRMITNFKAAIDDNFFGVIGLRYNATDHSGDSNGDAWKDDKIVTDGHKDLDVSNTTGTFNVHQFYLGYTAGNTTITAGKQVLGTFFTDDLVGTGVKVVNTDITGLTLAALAVDALDNSSFSDGGLWDAVRSNKYDTGNLYGVAAIGSYDPVAFQLWYASLTNVADLLGVEVSSDIAINDNVAFGLKGQFVNNSADKVMKSPSAKADYSDGRFYAFEATTELFGAELGAGYINWKAKDYAKKTTGTTSFTFEDQGSLIDAGEQHADWNDYTAAKGKGSVWFLNAGYRFDKFFVGADYVQGTKKFAEADTKKEKFKEVVARASYKYSKKLTFTTWYSNAEIKNFKHDDHTGKLESDRYRFEAKYSF